MKVGQTKLELILVYLVWIEMFVSIFFLSPIMCVSDLVKKQLEA